MKTNDYLITMKKPNGIKRRRKENNNVYNFSGKKKTECSKYIIFKQPNKIHFQVAADRLVCGDSGDQPEDSPDTEDVETDNHQD